MPKDPRRILIVDDEEGIRESFKLILGDFYHLVFAINADQALSALQNEVPSLAMLDIKMPRTNGLELLKQIRKLQPNLPIIIVSGYQSAETAQEASKNGASDYIPKPFDSRHILDTVRKLLP